MNAEVCQNGLVYFCDPIKRTKITRPEFHPSSTPPFSIDTKKKKKKKSKQPHDQQHQHHSDDTHHHHQHHSDDTHHHHNHHQNNNRHGNHGGAEHPIRDRMGASQRPDAEHPIFNRMGASLSRSDAEYNGVYDEHICDTSSMTSLQTRTTTTQDIQSTFPTTNVVDGTSFLFEGGNVKHTFEKTIVDADTQTETVSVDGNEQELEKKHMQEEQENIQNPNINKDITNLVVQFRQRIQENKEYSKEKQQWLATPLATVHEITASRATQVQLVLCMSDHRLAQHVRGLVSHFPQQAVQVHESDNCFLDIKHMNVMLHPCDNFGHIEKVYQDDLRVLPHASTSWEKQFCIQKGSLFVSAGEACSVFLTLVQSQPSHGPVLFYSRYCWLPPNNNNNKQENCISVSGGGTNFSSSSTTNIMNNDTEKSLLHTQLFETYMGFRRLFYHLLDVRRSSKSPDPFRVSMGVTKNHNASDLAALLLAFNHVCYHSSKSHQETLLQLADADTKLYTILDAMK